MAEFKPYGLNFVVKALQRAIAAEKNDALLELGAKEGSTDLVNVRRKRPLEHDKTVWERTAYVVRNLVFSGIGNGMLMLSRRALVRTIPTPTPRRRLRPTSPSSASSTPSVSVVVTRRARASRARARGSSR